MGVSVQGGAFLCKGGVCGLHSNLHRNGPLPPRAWLLACHPTPATPGPAPRRRPTPPGGKETRCPFLGKGKSTLPPDRTIRSCSAWPTDVGRLAVHFWPRFPLAPQGLAAKSVRPAVRPLAVQLGQLGTTASTQSERPTLRGRKAVRVGGAKGLLGHRLQQKVNGQVSGQLAVNSDVRKRWARARAGMASELRTRHLPASALGGRGQLPGPRLGEGGLRLTQPGLSRLGRSLAPRPSSLVPRPLSSRPSDQASLRSRSNRREWHVRALAAI